MILRSDIPGLLIEADLLSEGDDPVALAAALSDSHLAKINGRFGSRAHLGDRELYCMSVSICVDTALSGGYDKPARRG